MWQWCNATATRGNIWEIPRKWWISNLNVNISWCKMQRFLIYMNCDIIYNFGTLSTTEFNEIHHAKFWKYCVEHNGTKQKFSHLNNTHNLRLKSIKSSMNLSVIMKHRSFDQPIEFKEKKSKIHLEWIWT